MNKFVIHNCTIHQHNEYTEHFKKDNWIVTLPFPTDQEINNPVFVLPYLQQRETFGKSFHRTQGLLKFSCESVDAPGLLLLHSKLRDSICIEASPAPFLSNWRTPIGVAVKPPCTITSSCALGKSLHPIRPFLMGTIYPLCMSSATKTESRSEDKTENPGVATSSVRKKSTRGRPRGGGQKRRGSTLLAKSRERFAIRLKAL